MALKQSNERNPEKCHLITNIKNTDLAISIANSIIKNSSEEKLLGVNFDNHLHFETNIYKICKSASQKISALSRLVNYMTFAQKRLIMNAFFKAQFSYCPLIWMFHSRTLSNEINNLHERCLRLIYNNKTSSFKKLLEKDLQVFIIETYKH